MKCNLEKINQFLKNDKICQEVKDLVLNVFGSLFENKNYQNGDRVKFFFLGLEFYEIEEPFRMGTLCYVSHNVIYCRKFLIRYKHRY